MSSKKKTSTDFPQENLTILNFPGFFGISSTKSKTLANKFQVPIGVMATVDDKNRIPFTNKVLVLETSALFFVGIEFKGCFTKHFPFKWRDNAPLLEVFVLLLQNTAEKTYSKRRRQR